VGSTTKDTVAQRLAQHVYDYKKWKNGKQKFYSSFDIIERGDYAIVLLENYPCENNDQLRAKEQEWKQLIKSNNRYNCFTNRTDYKKNYYVENIEKIKERQNEKNICECGGHLQQLTNQNT
jgi:hypothetical protein